MLINVYSCSRQIAYLMSVMKTTIRCISSLIVVSLMALDKYASAASIPLYNSTSLCGDLTLQTTCFTFSGLRAQVSSRACAAMLERIHNLGPQLRTWTESEYNWDDEYCNIMSFATATTELGKQFPATDILFTLATIFDKCDRSPGYGGASDMRRGQRFDYGWRVRVIGRPVAGGGDEESECLLEGSASSAS